MRRRNERVTGPARRLLAAVMAGLPVVWALAAASEMRVPLDDVVDAYESGDVALAREISVAYLDMYEEQAVIATTDLDRRSSAVGSLGILRYMLVKEMELPPERQFGGDPELLRRALVRPRVPPRDGGG